MTPLLSIQNLSVRFGDRTVLQPLDLHLQRGELLALVGESGSGKSVTALALLQLLPETADVSGSLLFFEEGSASKDLLRLPRPALEALRGNRIAMIFQEPMTALNPVLTCGRQVTEVLEKHEGLGKNAARTSAVDWLRKVRLPDPEGMMCRYPHQLSGGQKQRVMIAMALCCRPALLICDEPTTALDVTVQRSILQTIRQLQQELHMAVLFITHDLGVVSEIADRIAVLYQGALLETGPTANVLRNPQQAYTKALLACRPALHPRGERLPVVADFLEAPSLKPTPLPLPEPQAEKAVEIRDLVVRFPGRRNLWGKTVRSFTAVDGVNLDIFKGETLGLVGESGCGKSTLGRALLRLVTPQEGTVCVGGADLTLMRAAELRSFRKEVQLVFQDPYSALNPKLTIGEALEEPLALRLGLSRSERKRRVQQLLDQVGLPTGAASRHPHAFSGGQRQRIVIARALTLNPSVLVCDESVSALDVSVQAQVLNLLNDLRRDLGLTMLFISHDLSVVRYMSDRIAVMQAGRIVEMGPADAVYHHPQQSYTKELLEAIPGRSRI
ncbi:MAG: ABC transporter ATP-binding protein [Chitinophagaceae bacterium]|nr:MAG: ABC transporter ATP-binding protein [Chitinophagaceae bacterium]